MKRAKKATVILVKTESSYSKFDCPHCHTLSLGLGLPQYVTRFKCPHCKNEIIIEDWVWETKKIKTRKV